MRAHRIASPGHGPGIACTQGVCGPRSSSTTSSAANKFADRCGCELGGVGRELRFRLMSGPRGGRPIVSLYDADGGVGRWPRRAVRAHEVRIWRRDQHEPEVAVATIGGDVWRAIEARGIGTGDLLDELAELPHTARLNKMAKRLSRS